MSGSRGGTGKKDSGAASAKGERHVWDGEQYTVLYLLHTQWQLESKDAGSKEEKKSRKIDVETIFCDLYPDFGSHYKKGRANLLYSTFNDRWQSGKPQIWREIDRPNDFDKSRYSVDELEYNLVQQEKIERAARRLNIQLETSYPTRPFGYGRAEDKSAIDALLKAGSSLD